MAGLEIVEIKWKMTWKLGLCCGSEKATWLNTEDFLRLQAAVTREGALLVELCRAYHYSKGYHVTSKNQLPSCKILPTDPWLKQSVQGVFLCTLGPWGLSIWDPKT